MRVRWIALAVATFALASGLGNPSIRARQDPAASPSPAASPVPTEPRPLAPVVWQLAAYAGPGGEEFPVDAPDRYTLQAFPDGRLAIRADCNRAMGHWADADGGTRFTIAGSTRAQCPDESGSDAFLAAIGTADAWRYEDAGLVLLLGELPLLRLTAQLPGVVWEWQVLREGTDAETVPDDPSRYTLEFRPDGSVALGADCNRGRAGYTVDGEQISFTGAATTKAACPPGSLGDAFVRDVTDSTSFLFRDGQLILVLPVDAGTLEFAPTVSAQPES